MTNMTHEQLVEKVSKAICMANCHNPDAVLTDNLDHSKWEIYVPDARASIATIAEALKEPTEAMIDAGRNETFSERHFLDVFRAMLTASPLHKEKA